MGKLADEIRAKTARANRINYYKQLIAAGKTERAAAYAKTYSLPTSGPEVEPTPVVATPIPAAPEVAAPIAVEVAPEPTPPAETETHINGWPKIALAKVWRLLPNRNLIAVKLIDDGRIVSMWNVRNATWRINSTVRVKIDKSEGDPVYSFVKQRDDEIPLDREAIMGASSTVVLE